MEGRTVYSTMDKNWDLDFAAMIAAHRLIGHGGLRMEDFERKVVVHTPENGWLVWDVEGGLEGGREEHVRRKIVTVKEKLTAMGKEGLFFRWIELVQFETAAKGGSLTAAGLQEVMKKGEVLFNEQGVGFQEFWTSVGGWEGMPGMDIME